MEKPNVLLITLDAVRPDRLELFGGRVRTPNLMKLAAGGLVCSEAWSQGPVTWISHASVFSGLWPHHHGLTDVHTRLDPGAATLAERLRAAGYRTAGWPATVLAGAELGLDRGFERFDEHYETPMPFWRDHFPNLEPGEGFAFVDFAENLRRFSQWIKSGPGPWMAWLHYFDVHYMYEHVFKTHGPPPELIRQYYPRRFWRYSSEARRVQFYDAKVAWADHWLGRVLEQVDLERTVVAVFSDHGEGFDYPIPDHDRCREEELRVLLLVSTAGRCPARTIEGPTRLVDLAPTVLDLAGLGGEGGARMDGVSLRETLPYPRMVLALNGSCRSNGGRPSYYMKWNRRLRSDPEQDKVRAALEGLGYV